MKHYIGAGAAATLGFIHGDLKGAYAGYKLYKKYQNWKMGRSNASRRSRISGTPSRKRVKLVLSPPTSNRRASIASGRSHISALSISSRRSSSGSSAFSFGSRSKVTDRTMTSRTNLVAVAKRKHKVKALHKIPKTVHVSKKLRAKVKKVISGKTPKGYYQVTTYGNFSSANNNKQNADYVYGQTVESTNVYGEFFSPTQILDAASVLWNHKPASAGVKISDATNLNPLSAMINVVKQWATIKFRNNSARNYYMSIYACRRKISQSVGAGENALDDWKDCLSNESIPGVNVNTVAATTLYATPFLCKAMSDKYKMELTKVTLAPGEEYIYTLEGPSMMYDFRKFNQGGLDYPFNKNMNVSVFFTGYVDLIGTSAGNFCRVGNGDASAGYGIAYETNYYYKLEMPEQAGVLWAASAGSAPYQDGQLVPAATKTTVLGERRDAYGIFTQAITVSGSAERVDREYPVSIAPP